MAPRQERVVNPFRYGDIASGPHFTDRRDELRELLLDIRGGQNVAIISPRRFGKTSLVLRAVEQARGKGILAAYVDLLRTPTKARLADHLGTAIYSGLVAPVERAWRQALDTFKSLPLHPKISANLDGTPSLEFTAGALDGDVDATIEALLALPSRIAERRGRRVALVLDEFQEVVELDPRLPAVMRSIFQHQSEVAHVFLGSKRHLMQRVFTDINEPLYRSARVVQLGPIPADELAGFIRERFASTSVPIAESAVERIIALGEGNPHDTQQLCSSLWSLAHDAGATATEEMVEQAFDRILRENDARYVEMWDSLTANQRGVLAAVAAEPGGVHGEAYRRRHRLGAASSVARAAEALLERGLIEPRRDDGYRVPEVFLRGWLARTSQPRPLPREPQEAG